MEQVIIKCGDVKVVDNHGNTIPVTECVGKTIQITNSIGAVKIEIEAPDQVVAGSIFTAKIGISEVRHFAGCQFDLTYDSNLLEVTNVTYGLIGSVTVEITGQGFVPPDVQGRIRVIGEVSDEFLKNGLSGSGYLAEIHFHAK